MEYPNLSSLYAAIETEVNLYNDYFEISNFFRLARDSFEKRGLTDEVRIAQIETITFGFRIENGSLAPYARLPNNTGELIDIPNMSDFKDNDCEYLIKRYKESAHPMLKARYAHVLWKCQRRDWSCANKAIDDYFDLIKIFETKDSINPQKTLGITITGFIRVICKLVCSINHDHEKIKSEIFRLLNGFNTKSPSFFVLKFDIIQIILDFPKIFLKSDLVSLTDLCWILGQDLIKQNNLHFAIRFFEMGERIDRKLEKPHDKWRRKIAEIYESMMQSALSNEKFDLASTFCLHAIEEYQKINDHEKKNALSKILATIKLKFTYKEISQEIDLSDYIKYCKQIGIQINQLESFEIVEFFLSEKALIPDLNVVKQRAKEIDQKYVLTRIFPTVLYDSYGNPIQIFSTDTEKNHYSILQQYKLELEMRNQFLIKEIIITMILEGKVNSDVIIEYLKHFSWIGNDFDILLPNQKSISYSWLELVRPSLDNFFYEMAIRITFPTYHPNLILFIDSFILKLEGIIREFCKRIGVPTFISKREGIAYEKVLEDLLREEKLSDFFYDDEIFFLKFILIEKAGYNLRNRTAHALMIPSEYAMQYAFYLIIAFLKLCNVSEIRLKYSRWDAFTPVFLIH
jgi:hypothetical protein